MSSTPNNDAVTDFPANQPHVQYGPTQLEGPKDERRNPVDGPGIVKKCETPRRKAREDKAD
jgi:hypothetical protein